MSRAFILPDAAEMIFLAVAVLVVAQYRVADVT